MAITDTSHVDDSDVALIRRTRAGDNGAYGVLHRRHRAAASAAARRMSRSDADADDLVAEGFARVLATLQRGAGPEVAFRPYLLSTIRRLAYDRTDREQREAPVEYDMEQTPAGGDDPVVAGFEREAAVAAFSSLPERWRMVLWHTEVEGQSAAQVAALLGTKPNAVAALAYRAREGLRQAYLSQHAAAGPAAPVECRAVNDRLAAYVRDGLSPAQQARVRDHLDDCDDCAAAYLELVSVNTSLKGVVGLAVLGSLWPAYAEDAAALLIPGAAGAAAAGASGSATTASSAWWPPKAGPQAVAAVAVVVTVLAVAAAAFVGLRSNEADVAGGTSASSAPGDADASPSSGADGASDRSSSSAPVTGSSGGFGTGHPPGPDPTPVAPAAEPSASPAPVVEPSPATPPPPPPPPPPAVEPSPATPPPPGVPPPAPDPSELSVELAAAGSIVSERPGVVVVRSSNQGTGPGVDVVVEADLGDLELRGLPITAAPSTAPSSAGAATWTCESPTTSRLVCRSAEVDPGASESFYIPVAAPAGRSSTTVTVAISGDGDPGDAPAATVIPIEATGMAARFALVDRGGISVAGNTLVSCPEANPQCSAARTGEGRLLDNGSFTMEMVNSDLGLGALNSSSASVDLPPGAEVLTAQLYWGGNLAGGSGGGAAPDPDLLDVARLRGPDDVVHEVTAERVDTEGSVYQATADVTELVGAGGAGAWTVADVQLGTGAGGHGGWSLAVVYRHAGSPLRSLVLLDGMSRVGAGSSVEFDLGGFVVPDSGASAATLDVVVHEGDAGLTGDQLSVGGVALANDANPLGNTFNSSASDRGGTGPDRDPGHRNLFGLDIDRFDIATALAPGTSSVTVEFSTSADVYLPGVVAFVVDQ